MKKIYQLQGYSSTEHEAFYIKNDLKIVFRYRGDHSDLFESDNLDDLRSEVRNLLSTTQKLNGHCGTIKILEWDFETDSENLVDVYEFDFI